MKYLTGYTDFFMSPVTGLSAIAQALPDLEKGYVWLGNDQNRPVPSYKLIDLTIDVKSLQKQFDVLSQAPFVLNTPIPSLPKAQALSTLGDGMMKNIAGLIQIAIPNTDYLTPALPSGQLFRGNAQNLATPQQTITLDNLPNLGVAIIQGLDLPAGRIWRGTASNRPEESDALSEAIADILLLNGRFLLGEFVMGDALVQATYPKAQFLINLEDGILKKTGKTLEHAVSGTDYVDTADNPIAEKLPVWSQNNQKLLTNTHIQVVNGEDVRGVNSLHGVLLQATNAVTSDADMISRNTVQTTELILFDRDPAHRQNIGVSLKGPASILQNLKWVMPETLSATGQVLTDIGSVPLSTDRQLAFRNMPSVDATYILKQPHESLPNAQALNQLVGVDPKILKATADGTIEVAVRDQDYATKETLEQIKVETEEFKNQAATSAEEAAASAQEATTAAGEATTAAGEATAAAGEATGAATAASGSAAAALGSAGAAALSALAAAGSASSASSSASDASSSASKASDSEKAADQSAQDAATSLNTLLNTGITLEGAIKGSGNLRNPIETQFQDNPVLPGKGSVTLPGGSISDRPTVPIVGMLRYTTGR